LFQDSEWVIVPDVKHFDPDQVLDTVVRLFWQRGAGATGIQDVVATTGLSRSSLYATFGGKQALYLAALRRYVSSSGPAWCSPCWPPTVGDWPRSRSSSIA
jgi:TetR/AcrR family transcriptional repressor of nem operon